MADSANVRPQMELQQWRTSYDFVGMALCNMAGITRLWNFQYLVFRNGGGAFLIPYLICFMCVAAPLMLLEFTVGQFSKASPLTCWEFCPLFSGCGISMVIVSVLTSIFYSMFIAWGLFLFCTSFTPDVPWRKCGSWSTPYCVDNVKIIDKLECTLRNGTAADNGLCVNHDNPRHILVWNFQKTQTTSFHRFNAAEEYFERVVLGDGVHNVSDLGEVRLHIVLTLLLTWVIVWLLLVKGINVFAKYYIWSMAVPCAFFVMFLIRGLMLDGSRDGILFYLIPDVNHIFTLQVWTDAIFQVFITSSAAFGQLIALSRYNDFHCDMIGSILFLTVASTVCHFVVGIMIFSYAGFLTKLRRTKIRNVVNAGAGMAFRIVPSAVSEMSGTPLWGLAFFFMVNYVSLGSELLHVETVLASILDFKPELKNRKIYVLSCTCAVCFILGIPFTTQGGRDLLVLLFTNTAGINLLIIALCECIAVGWIYGADRMLKDLNYMIGHRCCVIYRFGKCGMFWFKICWMIITPGLLLFVFLAPNNAYPFDYPLWGKTIAYILSASCSVSIILVALIQVCRASGTFRERWKFATTPSKQWTSAVNKHRQQIRKYMSDLMIYIDKQRVSIQNTKEEPSLSKKDSGLSDKLPSYVFNSSLSKKDSRLSDKVSPYVLQETISLENGVTAV